MIIDKKGDIFDNRRKDTDRRKKDKSVKTEKRGKDRREELNQERKK